ncbi:alpha/beta fold hydrolase [Nocardioides mangrovicus]|uniref:Alpha/beta fold hydrolase n=1 Tax=Nocardioides mangrovicus TaxID=2478913 RepID=A0A3L8P7V7_9ACTN|nr:alpha/beta fold hydrolase [Nocardioides mangrovicus]RLV51057.1 alpha/beta fold hydrolase [Nocardioides mangrovicus]
MVLSSTTIGEAGPWVVFCHGLFGQGKNWTTVAKALAVDHRCLLLDMPQHGRSPWSEEFDYLAVADAVADALPHEPVALVGHSMGGKIAMLVALRHPELVERLMVVDVAPVARDARSGFEPYVAAMRGVDLAHLARRHDASQAMRAGVPDDGVRGFLLQNLRHDPTAPEGEQWRWQMNLDVLGDSLDAIGGWPEVAGSYDGPVLWVAGERSDYIRDADLPAMKALFPRVRKVSIKGAGHWVHSEQPEVFVAVLRRFVTRSP